MNTIIYLVRHGETDWNTSGKFQGCTDIALNANGIIQANLLSKRFKDDFDYIYSSPLKRARATATIIADNKNTQPIIAPGMREINFGKWEGLTTKEISTNYPSEFGIWRKDEKDAPLIGGDGSIKAASIRAQAAVMEIAKNHKGKKIIIVSHGGIIKAALIGLFQWKMTMYHKLLLSNTCINKIEFDENLEVKLHTLNDTSHITTQSIYGV